MEQKKKKRRNNKRLIKVLFFLVILCMVFTIAPNYKKQEQGAFTILYQNEDRTSELIDKEKIVDQEVYLALEDIQSLFRQESYIDETNQWIVLIGNTRVVAISITGSVMHINSVEVSMDMPVLQEKETYYIPLSVMEQVDNIDIDYIEETNTIVIDSKDTELIRADVTKKVKVKAEKKTWTNAIETLEKGESTIFIANEENGWAKVRTLKGNIGYIKQKNLTNFYTVRENKEMELVNQETKEITNMKELKKVKMITLEDIQTYEAREKTIEAVVDQCVVNQVEMLEYADLSLQEQDETSYHRFIKELKVRLAEVGIELKS